MDETASKLGAPVLPCRTFESVPIGEMVRYRIPLVPNARRFKAGYKIRLYLTTDDQGEDKPALLMFRHASVGTSSPKHDPLIVALDASDAAGAACILTCGSEETGNQNPQLTSRRDVSLGSISTELRCRYHARSYPVRDQTAFIAGSRFRANGGLA